MERKWLVYGVNESIPCKEGPGTAPNSTKRYLVGGVSAASEVYSSFIVRAGVISCFELYDICQWSIKPPKWTWGVCATVVG